MFCYIFRLSLKQSYGKNKQRKTACGQQLCDCILVGIHYTLDVWSRGKQFCFPESPDVSRVEVEGNIRTRGKTKLTSFPRDHTLSVLLCSSKDAFTMQSKSTFLESFDVYSSLQICPPPPEKFFRGEIIQGD